MLAIKCEVYLHFAQIHLVVDKLHSVGELRLFPTNPGAGLYRSQLLTRSPKRSQ